MISYARRDGDDHVLVILNLTPVTREHYRIGAPSAGRYVQLLSTDDLRYGGSGVGAWHGLDAEAVPFHGYPQSLTLTLPPLGVVVLAPDAGGAR